MNTMTLWKHISRVWLPAVSILFMLVAGFAPSVHAQDLAGGWAPDERVPGYLDETFTPVLVADQNRTVHAFASQWVGQSDRQLAVVYRQWSLAGGWTKPVDILLPPLGGTQVQSAFLDSSGILHVIFWAGTSREAYIFYSQAPAVNADQGSAWSEPLPVGWRAVEPSSAAISGDDKGNLVVIYAGNIDGPGVYETHSNNSGRTWTKARSAFLTSESGLVPFSLRLFMGTGGQLHAAWNVVTNRGSDSSLHYARYTVDTEEWAESVMLNKRIEITDYFGPSFPSIVDNGEDVVIMYNNGNPFSGRPIPPGRPVQMVNISNDNGQTWQEPMVPFYRLLGRSGEHSLVVDSAGNIHALFTQRVEYVENGINREIGGMWHSSYKAGVWNDPERFITSYAPHDVRAVVSQGNVLLVVWRQDPGAEILHGVWFSYKVLDSPELPVVTPATAVIENTAPTSDPGLGSNNPQSIPTDKPQINLEGSPVGLTNNPAGPLLIAMIPVVLILIVVIFIYRAYRSRSQ